VSVRPSDLTRDLAAVAGPCETDQITQLQPLIELIRERFGQQLVAIVYYGSCLRSGDPYDGLLDFYVIVERYGPPGQARLSAGFNRLIPPNVYYAERDGAHGRLRCKYAVLSTAQLHAGTARWFQSAIWGRFAQPIAIVFARSDKARTGVQAACGQAVVTLLNRTLPALKDGMAPARAFAQALALSYASELRVESSTRSQSLVEQDQHEYARRIRTALPMLGLTAQRQDSDGCLHWQPSDQSRTKRLWALRRVVGKWLSVARLLKACFTFTDAVDYAAFKIERHTGVSIPVNERMRRHPLLFGWFALWRVYRQRLLR